MMTRTLGRKSPQLLMIGVLLLAFWLRLWQLDRIPPGLSYDEAYPAMNAAWVVATASPQIYFIDNPDHEALFQNFMALFMAFVGVNAYTYHLGGVFIGLLTIALLYRWSASLFQELPDRAWLGLIAAVALSLSLWHVKLNRLGFQSNTVAPFFLLSAYLFWRGWRQGSIWSW